MFYVIVKTDMHELARYAIASPAVLKRRLRELRETYAASSTLVLRLRRH